ncbi:MAG: hypothetical protein H0W65_01795 [Sphingomonas sp.]|uniref:hypothetical protein n=1 Tax=Sphingomonas sp. TaxID=28214 RepID=UPI00180B8F56|nr:hypothetical protein [Sphingomonas sp.]MBA3666442.1 hypothetical protein [Sphingomonas sp.]
MNFLKTLLWVVVAVFLAIFATRNWSDVTVNLWGNLQAEIKIPILLALIFLIGFLPTFLILRGRLWALKRRLLTAERPALVPINNPSPDIEPDPAS